MRELHIKIAFNIIHTIPSGNFKKNNLKFPFKTKVFSCILFLQGNSYFSQNCVHMVLWYDVKSATLDSLICTWFGYGRGNDSTVRENTTAS